METKCFKAGDKAPDFILNDHKGEEFRLSNFKGKRILLSFHPLAWTTVCAKQMQALERYQTDFEELNTVAVGLSVDTVPSKKAWADLLGIRKTRLLSDFWPHGDIAKMYGIFREEGGTSERVNLIINENQEIEFIRIYELSELPDIKEILIFLRGVE
jgi:peroxiredoxin